MPVQCTDPFVCLAASHFKRANPEFEVRPGVAWIRLSAGVDPNSGVRGYRVEEYDSEGRQIGAGSYDRYLSDPGTGHVLFLPGPPSYTPVSDYKVPLLALGAAGLAAYWYITRRR